jgi:predicted glycosyltransferase
MAPQEETDGQRFLLYSHDGTGLGHLRRNLAIAEALTSLDPRAGVLLAHGNNDLAGLAIPPRTDVLQLPGLAKVNNGRYCARRLPVGPDQIRDVRAAVLAGAVASFRPHVLLADKHPRGASGELVPALEELACSGGRAVLGIRDILDDPVHVRREWEDSGGHAAVARYHDLVLVYGHRRLYDPVAAYGLGSEIAARTRFCGYVTSNASTPPLDEVPPPDTKGAPLVVATVGGGEDGSALLDAFVDATARRDWCAVAVTGPLADPRRRLDLRTRAATAGVACHRFVPDLGPWLEQAAVVVAMGGYNTLVEAVARGVPVVCVPRIRPRREQLLRAELFARHGLLRLVHPDRLDPFALRAAIDAAARSRTTGIASRARELLGLDGAAVAAGHLLALAGSAPAYSVAVAS